MNCESDCDSEVNNCPLHDDDNDNIQVLSWDSIQDDRDGRHEDSTTQTASVPNVCSKRSE
jgi:hypothetical protein